MLSVTPIYASLLAFLFIWLSYRVVLGRRQYSVSVGDGDDKDLRKRMRVQANWAEYAPIGILMLGMAEIQGMPGWLVHVFGLMLLLGRTLHAYGLGKTPQIIPARIWGMYLTITMIILTALANLAHALF